jgi:hypothetical protein
MNSGNPQNHASDSPRFTFFQHLKKISKAAPLRTLEKQSREAGRQQAAIEQARPAAVQADSTVNRNTCAIGALSDFAACGNVTVRPASEEWKTIRRESFAPYPECPRFRQANEKRLPPAGDNPSLRKFI